MKRSIWAAVCAASSRDGSMIRASGALPDRGLAAVGAGVSGDKAGTCSRRDLDLGVGLLGQAEEARLPLADKNGGRQLGRREKS